MKHSWWMWAICGVMVIGGGYALWTRGVTDWAAYGMLLLCPLMHVFMMGGHGGHDHDHGKKGGAEPKTSEGGASCH